MTRTHLTSIAFVFATGFAGQAMAANTSTTLTRDQVKAELAEAVRTGNIVVGESSARLNEMLPQRYSAQQTASSVTREQVKAELAEARRTGNIVAGESSAKLNEMFPQQYPAQQARSSVTREQVKAELAEAIKMGLVPTSIGA